MIRVDRYRLSRAQAFAIASIVRDRLEDGSTRTRVYAHPATVRKLRELGLVEPIESDPFAHARSGPLTEHALELADKIYRYTVERYPYMRAGWTADYLAAHAAELEAAS